MDKPLKVAVASDHAGIALKKAILEELAGRGIDASDLGPQTAESVDYPDFAAAVARAVSSGGADRGILVCGTGIGMAIAAGKFPGIRAAVLYDDFSAKFSRQHNDANIAVFGARTMATEDVLHRVGIFVTEPFEGGRHANRLQKIADIEKSECDKK